MMRARNRHSASNYLFAAFLELVIMGIFVVIAQPQLRQSLFEMLERPAKAIAAPKPSATDSAASERALYEGHQYAAGDAAHRDVAKAMAYEAELAQAGAVPNSAPSLDGLRWPGQAAGWSTTPASYTPLEQFETFTVATSSSAVPASTAIFTSENRSAEKRVAGYPPAVGPTQLSAIDWNIASASQSPRPSSGWTAPRRVEADYRDTYPPPYGTQSQWK